MSNELPQLPREVSLAKMVNITLLAIAVFMITFGFIFSTLSLEWQRGICSALNPGSITCEKIR